jgi:two-component system cell cycle sensor histidine kinase/response regulator CckA
MSQKGGPGGAPEELRRAQRIDALGRLAAEVAHDINNLLFVVLSYADLAVERAERGGLVAQEADELRAAARRAADLTRQLLALGRRQTPRPERIDLGELLRGMEGMLRRLLGPHVTLSIQQLDGPWPVMADRAHLEQAVMNLASNARDAMNGQGTLAIEVANVEIDADAHVVLTMRDSGSGMDEITKSRAFDPYFTTKEADTGTGLGLALVRDIVEESGGRVDVESSPGQGANFRVRLPRACKHPDRDA